MHRLALFVLLLCSCSNKKSSTAQATSSGSATAMPTAPAPPAASVATVVTPAAPAVLGTTIVSGGEKVDASVKFLVGAGGKVSFVAFYPGAPAESVELAALPSVDVDGMSRRNLAEFREHQHDAAAADTLMAIEHCDRAGDPCVGKVAVRRGDSVAIFSGPIWRMTIEKTVPLHPGTRTFSVETIQPVDVALDMSDAPNAVQNAVNVKLPKAVQVDKVQPSIDYDTVVVYAGPFGPALDEATASLEKAGLKSGRDFDVEDAGWAGFDDDLRVDGQAKVVEVYFATRAAAKQFSEGMWKTAGIIRAPKHMVD